MTYGNGIYILKCSAFYQKQDFILNVAIFNYSLHNFRETILHWKCQLL